MKTIGIVVVAALAANAGGLFAAVITATRRVTNSPGFTVPDKLLVAPDEVIE